MCDTNWCTFCDCAVSSISNSIYCSKECFKLDALTRHPLYAPYVAEKTKVSAATDSIMMSPTTQPLHIDQYNSRDSNSDYTGSSVSSEDLAAMYFDLVPRASQPHQLSIKTPPLLSTGMPSPASSQEDPILSFTTFSYSLSIDKKTTRDYNGSRNP